MVRVQVNQVSLGSTTREHSRPSRVLRRQLGEIFHELARHKESKIVEGHLMGDHVHVCLSIPPKYAVANVVGYIKGKSAIQIARTFGDRQRNFTGESFWARRFAGIDLGEMPVPDESTVCRFRHLLEAHTLGKKLFEQVHAYLERQGIKVGTGTIVDATIISAPPSTKNKDKRRDPDMHQTKKGNQWYFGMKAHIGVDSQTKVIHAVAATPANVHDSVCLSDLLHGEETRVWGDSAYQGQSEVIRAHAPKAKDFTHRRYRYKDTVDEEEQAKNKIKSSVRAKVEHPFLIIKRIFGFVKTLAKRGRPRDGPAWRPEDGTHTACSSPVR